jgi:hypothetical protein
MKVATILPTAFLGLIAKDDYHMCLAHLIDNLDKPIEKQNKYTKFYRQMGLISTKYLILDNGVIEQNKATDIVELVKKAMSVSADEIILPDVIMDSERTLDAGEEALKWVRNNFPFKIMAVPQGKTREEWLDCAEIMLGWDIDCIGIPKSLSLLGSRDIRIDVLHTLGKKLRGLDIHLLGCQKSPMEVRLMALAMRDQYIPEVRGIDSALPYVFTKAGLSIDEDDRPKIPFSFNETNIDLKLLKKNIANWQDSTNIDNWRSIDV